MHNNITINQTKHFDAGAVMVKKSAMNFIPGEVTICIPVLNNYNGLIECIQSIEQGTIKPDRICIFDNGRSFNNRIVNNRIYTVVPEQQMSVAKAWNWFIDNVPETRIIINDDIIFNKDSLEKFLLGMDKETISFPAGMGIHIFSFFSIPDIIINKVGKFDEEFYPAYYEDTSYNYRMKVAGIKLYEIYDCRVNHIKNKTPSLYDKKQLRNHHALFQRNETIYVQMWGGPPGQERYKTKFNG